MVFIWTFVLAELVISWSLCFFVEEWLCLNVPYSRWGSNCPFLFTSSGQITQRLIFSITIRSLTYLRSFFFNEILFTLPVFYNLFLLTFWWEVWIRWRNIDIMIFQPLFFNCILIIWGNQRISFRSYHETVRIQSKTRMFP